MNHQSGEWRFSVENGDHYRIIWGPDGSLRYEWAREGISSEGPPSPKAPSPQTHRQAAGATGSAEAYPTPSTLSNQSRQPHPSYDPPQQYTSTPSVHPALSQYSYTPPQQPTTAYSSAPSGLPSANLNSIATSPPRRHTAGRDGGNPYDDGCDLEDPRVAPPKEQPDWMQPAQGGGTLSHRESQAINQPEPFFEVGDPCQMVVRFMVHGQPVTTFKFFTIRARRFNQGRYEYQLYGMSTGQEYQGESWYSEADLGRA